MADDLADLGGRAVLVTGGSSGIGLGMAAGLVRANAAVCIAARSPERNQQAVEELRQLGGAVTAVSCDVTDESSVVAAVAATTAAFGRIDGAIVNAGAEVATHPIHEYPLSDWRTGLASNLDGAFVTVREVAAELIRQDRPGSIVVVSSIATRYGQPARAPYAAAKTALLSLVRTAAVELGRYGIRVNAVLPGWTDTPMLRPLVDADEGSAEAQAGKVILGRTPLRRWGSPADFAGIATYFMSPVSAFHTGDVVTIDGGYSIY